MSDIKNVTSERLTEAELMAMSLSERAKYLFGDFMPNKIDSSMNAMQIATIALVKAERQKGKSLQHAEKEKALFAFYGANAGNQKIVQDWLASNGYQPITTGNY